MIEVLKQAYQLLLTEPHAPTVCGQLEVIFRQAIAEWESQEPVATVTSETGADITMSWWHEPTMSWWHEPALPIGTKLFTHPPQRTEQKIKDDWHCQACDGALCTAKKGCVALSNPPQRTEQNFCPRCGKRTNDIHTCTPPQEKNNG